MATWHAMDMAALKGETVTQGHADFCAEHGHAKHTHDGVVSAFCPRCGAIIAPDDVAKLTCRYCRKSCEPLPAEIEITENGDLATCETCYVLPYEDRLGTADNDRTTTLLGSLAFYVAKWGDDLRSGKLTAGHAEDIRKVERLCQEVDSFID